MSIAIVNLSTMLSDKDGSTIVIGLNDLLQKFCSDWSLQRYTASYIGLGQQTSIALKVFIMDTSDISATMPYSDIKDGAPHGKCFVKPLLDNKGVILYSKNPKANTLAQLVSHEVFELLVDPLSNTWWSSGFENNMVAGEVCDAVQGNLVTVNVVISPAKSSYDPLLKKNVVTPVELQLVNYSDWVLPEWSNHKSKFGPYNHLNTITSPFLLAPSGYLVILSAGSQNEGLRAIVYGTDVTPEEQEKHSLNFRVSKRLV